MANQLLDQQVYWELAVEPGLGTPVVTVGQVPTLPRDLKCLKTNATCQLARDHSSTLAAGKASAGKVVDSITYIANS